MKQKMIFQRTKSILLILLCLCVNIKAENNIEVNGIEIIEKSNGTLITILLSKYLSEDNISGWFRDSGWFYLTMHGVIIDTAKSWAFSKTGAISKIEIYQTAESAQFNFRIKDNVENFEIASNSNGKVLLTLRQPLIESFHAINNARNNKTSKEITLESVKEPTWKDALPFGLIFLGGGLSSKGILRSDSVTTTVGLISIVTGWFLKTKENNKNIS